MNNPIISRVVTCFEQWNYVRKWCLNDDLFLEGVEWIFINDAPHDPFPRDIKLILKKKNARIFSHKFNQGRCIARNWGAQLANGLWVEHIDGDDLPLKIDLSHLNNHNDKEILAFKTGYHENSHFDNLINERNNIPIIENQNAYFDFLLPNYVPIDPRPVGTLWNREAFLSIGGYDGRYESIEDLHLVWKAHKAKLRIAHIDICKQSHFRGTQKPTPLVLGPGFINFWNLVKKTDDQNIHLINNEIVNATKVFYWSSLGQLKKLKLDTLKFKIKETIKWFLSMLC